MKKDKMKKSKENEVGRFQTFPLADTKTIDPYTNASTPSLENVEEAKAWVDFNEK